MAMIDRRLAVKRPLVFMQAVHVSVSFGIHKGGHELNPDEAIWHSSTILGSQILN